MKTSEREGLRPELLIVADKDSGDLLVDSMVSQLIEQGIYFSSAGTQRVPDSVPEDFDAYRAVLLDQKTLQNLKSDEKLLSRLEKYGSSKGFVFSFDAGGSGHAPRLSPSAGAGTACHNMAHWQKAQDIVIQASLRRFHPCFEKIQLERSDDEIISGLKETLVENLRNISVWCPWNEFTKFFWKSAIMLTSIEGHEDIADLLASSIRRMFDEVPEFSGPAPFFGAAWLYRNTGEREPLEKAREALEKLIQRGIRGMGVLSEGGLIDDPLGLSSRQPHFNASWRDIFWPETLHDTGGSLSAMTRVTKDPRFRGEALKLIRHCVHYNIDGDNLVFHCTRRGEPVGHKWTRAQSHALYGMLHTMEEMEEDDPERKAIISVIRRIGTGLREHQDPGTGLWRNLIDHPDARLESTGTAAFTYIYGRGIKEGWLRAAEFEEMVRRGRKGLKLCYWRNGFAASGRGTRPGACRAFYLGRPQGWSNLPQGLIAMLASRDI